VIKDYPKSAQARLAEKKVELLKEGSQSLKDVAEFYNQLHFDLFLDIGKKN
jgi:hypothetical protein